MDNQNKKQDILDLIESELEEIESTILDGASLPCVCCQSKSVKEIEDFLNNN